MHGSGKLLEKQRMFHDWMDKAEDLKQKNKKFPRIGGDQDNGIMSNAQN